MQLTQRLYSLGEVPDAVADVAALGYRLIAWQEVGATTAEPDRAWLNTSQTPLCALDMLVSALQMRMEAAGSWKLDMPLT